jgi:tRNA dimethylallyltransferase
MKRVIAIVGPTAVGKTKISIELAKRLDAQIISGDSVAVYKELNIGSAKPTKEEMQGVKHYLIDELEPTEQYDVMTFQHRAREIIDNSSKPIIICGGTGLYIKSVLYNYEFEAPKRDDSLEERFKDFSNEELFNYLLKIDPDFDQTRIHMNNRKRVLRAIEIKESSNESIEHFNKKNEPYYEPYIVYLNIADRDLLYKRINERVDEMFAHGLLYEVFSLYKKGITPNAIGYKELIPFFNKEVTLETATDNIKLNSRHLAKRQMTWFKTQMDTHFYEVNLDNIEQTIDTIYHDLKEFLK